MAEVIRADLSTANGAEVTQWLVDKGVTGGIQTWVASDGMHIIVDSLDAEAINAALVGFAPTADREQPYMTVPKEVKDAMIFLRNRGNAGDNVAKACFVLFKYLNDRIE